MVLAFVSFIVATAGFAVPRINFIGLGLALWSLAVLLGGARA